MDLLVTMAAELAAETGIVGVLGRGKTGDALDGSCMYGLYTHPMGPKQPKQL